MSIPENISEESFNEISSLLKESNYSLVDKTPIGQGQTGASFLIKNENSQLKNVCKVIIVPKSLDNSEKSEIKRKIEEKVKIIYFVL